jgi:hypothetical protein
VARAYRLLRHGSSLLVARWPADRAVVGVICIWSVAPGWIPPTRIPVIPTPGDEHNAIIPITPPPLIMPLEVITSEGRVALALPVLRPVNVIIFVELYVLNCWVWLYERLKSFVFTLVSDL